MKRARVAVAVSGGVDSLCALLLLRRAGYDLLALHGRFLPARSAPRPGEAADPLPGLEAACGMLGIPLHTVNQRALPGAIGIVLQCGKGHKIRFIHTQNSSVYSFC